MMKKVLVLFISLVCVLFCFTGCGKKADPMVLPEAKEISSIRIELIDGTELVFEDVGSIQKILAAISDGEATSMASVQDAPVEKKYGTVNLEKIDGTTTVFYYEKRGKYYIEQPYQGIYEMEDNLEHLFADIK